MLTPATAWLETFCRSDVEPVVLCTITDGVNTWNAASGSMSSSSDLYHTAVAVVGVSQLEAELDPLKRTITFGELYVDFADEWLRPIVVNYKLKGQQVDLEIGAASLDDASFISASINAQIEEIQPNSAEKIIRLILRGQLQILYNSTINYANWLNAHPLECLYDGAGGGILELGGGHTFDTSTFDRSDAAYDDINHILIGRVNAGLLWMSSNYERKRNVESTGFSGDTETCISLADGVCSLLNGHLVETEDGDIAFRRFSSSASSVDDWTDADFIPNTFEQEPLERNVINQVVLNLISNQGGEPLASHIFNETVSQSDYAYPGEAARVFKHDISTLWLASRMFLTDDFDDVDAGFILFGEGCHALSGNRADVEGEVDADHPIYLLIDSTDDIVSGGIEIVKATSITRLSATANICVLDANPNFTTVSDPMVINASISGLTRQLYGTTKPTTHDYDFTSVYDITLAVLLIEELFSRFKDGCPIVTFDTSLAKMPYQIGDLVTLDTDRYVAYGKDGITSSDKWEIIGKSVEPLAGVIHWRLAHAYTDSPTVSGEPMAVMQLESRMRDRRSQSNFVEAMHLESGGTITKTAGFNATIDAYRVISGNRVLPMRTQQTHTFTASKDTYVYISMRSEYGALVFVETALGAGTPTDDAGMLLIGKVVTDAVEITDIDQSDTIDKPILGSRCKAGSEVFAHISQAGALDNLTSITTRQIDSLTDNVYARTLDAALSGGKLNLASDAAGLVNTLHGGTYITADTVGVAQFDRIDTFSGRTLNQNRYLALRTLG